MDGVEEESDLIRRTLSSFAFYKPSLHSSNQLRRTDFISLPSHHKALLPHYLTRLNEIDDCIDMNAKMVEDMLNSGSIAFLGHEWDDSMVCSPGEGDMDKIRSTVKQVIRDYSPDSTERDLSYLPILSLLQRAYPVSEDIKVLIPGCGLGRLPFEIAKLGYSTVGNEFSYHMLIASNHILNSVTRVGEYSIAPWVHSLSNHWTEESALKRIDVPDVVARDILTNADFSMAAGEFVECFGNAESQNEFDVVVTCFFLDTAHNVISYIETIRNTLKEEGHWINIGPCLWHHEHGQNRHGKAAFDENGEFVGSIELSMQELLDLIERMGFEIEEKRVIDTPYIGHSESMLEHFYHAQLFTARLRKEC